MDVDDYLKKFLDQRLGDMVMPQPAKDATLKFWREKFDALRKHEESDEACMQEFMKDFGLRLRMEDF